MNHTAEKAQKAVWRHCKSPTRIRKEFFMKMLAYGRWAVLLILAIPMRADAWEHWNHHWYHYHHVVVPAYRVAPAYGIAPSYVPVPSIVPSYAAVPSYG